VTRTQRTLGAAAAAVVVVGAWEALVRWNHVPDYEVPGPSVILQAFRDNHRELLRALTVTLEVTAMALGTAVVLGVLFAVLMSQSEWLETLLFPCLVVLQVTPLIAIAPLIILWIDNLKAGLLVCAWLIAFFPIVSNTTVGLKSTDRGLEDLFTLYKARAWQRFFYLRGPSALPYFLAGLRISGGLALVGAVAAEFVAGAGGKGSGLAYQILNAGYQMKVPTMFAALALISATGLGLHLALTCLSHALLRGWHESASRGER
jgi:NitT/TauT family transport system permease protein